MGTRGVLSLGYVALALAVLVTLIIPQMRFRHSLDMVAGPPPISALNPRATWVSDTEYLYESDGAINGRTCEEMLVKRFVVAGGRQHGVSGRVERGELSAPGVLLAPEYKMSVQRGVTQGAAVRVTLPPGMTRRDVDWVGADQIVSGDKPCEDGWSGQAPVHRLFVR